MDCTEFLNRYSEYDDSLVPPAEADRFRRHMSACDACTRYDRVLRKGRMLARQVAGVEPSDDFVPRLHRRLWQECGLRARAAQRPAQAASALAAVTVLVVVTAALGLLALGDAGASTVEGAPVRVASAAPAPYHVGSRLLPRLPTTAPTEPRAWPVERVDPEGRSSYSPLVTGPPAYRGGRPFSGASISAYRTLD